MKKVLLIEDESSVVSFVVKGLTEQGYDVSVALDGVRGVQMALSGGYDLIILDIMLPGKNGLDVCQEIRAKNKKVAILMLTALGTSDNVVLGLETGADDYLVKPFKFIELLARIKTLLRRVDNLAASPGEEASVYTFVDIEVNDSSKTVKRGDTQLALTSTEYRLLLLFIKNQKKVLSRTQILEDVWGVNFDMSTNVVDVYVNYLRKKLEVNSKPRVIQTVIGMGYVLRTE